MSGGVRDETKVRMETGNGGGCSVKVSSILATLTCNLASSPGPLVHGEGLRTRGPGDEATCNPDVITLYYCML